MSEKYSVMMDGREPWFHRNNYPMTHDEVCETLNTQAAEIAELKRKLEDSQASHLAHHKVLERVTKANGKFAEGIEISKAMNDAQMIDRLRMESEIAELRKLICDMAEYAGKSDLQEIIQEAESKISELDADELKGLQLMRRVQAVISNPSEIPNSSGFLVTEADQREADRAIADGSAKMKLPETGHGITEVSP